MYYPNLEITLFWALIQGFTLALRSWKGALDVVSFALVYDWTQVKISSLVGGALPNKVLKSVRSFIENSDENCPKRCVLGYRSVRCERYNVSILQARRLISIALGATLERSPRNLSNGGIFLTHPFYGLSNNFPRIRVWKRQDRWFRWTRCKIETYVKKCMAPLWHRATNLKRRNIAGWKLKVIART